MNNEPIARTRWNGSPPIHVLMADPDDGRIIVRGRSDSHHVKQLALAAVREAFDASQSQSERVELDIEVAPIDGWQARRCALWPEWRAWIGCTNPVDPAAHGTPPFLITDAEKEI